MRASCSHAVAAARVHANKKGYEVIWPVPVGHDVESEGAAGHFTLGAGPRAFWLMLAKKAEEPKQEAKQAELGLDLEELNRQLLGRRYGDY